MKKLVLVLLFAVSTTQINAQSDQEQIVATVQGLFDAMHENDAEGIRALTDSVMRITFVRQTPEGVRPIVMTGEEFINLLQESDGRNFVEVMRNPVVQIDGPLATLWTEYQVHIDGNLSHCGFDAFHLIERSSGWKILHLSDTARRDCGEKWE